MHHVYVKVYVCVNVLLLTLTLTFMFSFLNTFERTFADKGGALQPVGLADDKALRLRTFSSHAFFHFANSRCQLQMLFSFATSEHYACYARHGAVERVATCDALPQPSTIVRPFHSVDLELFL